MDEALCKMLNFYETYIYKLSLMSATAESVNPYNGFDQLQCLEVEHGERCGARPHANGAAGSSEIGT